MPPFPRFLSIFSFLRLWKLFPQCFPSFLPFQLLLSSQLKTIVFVSLMFSLILSWRVKPPFPLSFSPELYWGGTSSFISRTTPLRKSSFPPLKNSLFFPSCQKKHLPQNPLQSLFFENGDCFPMSPPFSKTLHPRAPLVGVSFLLMVMENLSAKSLYPRNSDGTH